MKYQDGAPVEDYGCFSPAVASAIASMNIKTVCGEELLEGRKQHKDLVNRPCLGESTQGCAQHFPLFCFESTIGMSDTGSNVVMRRPEKPDWSHKTVYHSFFCYNIGGVAIQVR